jgi:hypothetical protein
MANLVEWHGFPEVQAALKQLDARVLQASRQSVIEGGMLAKRQMQLNATGRPGPQVRSGNLRRTIRNKLTRSGPLVFEEQVGPDGSLVYPEVLERGAVIRPTHGLYLVFQLPDGSWVRTRQVTIPPYPFVAPAMEYFRAVVAPALFERNLARAFSV